MRISLALRALILAVVMVGWMAAPALAEPTVLSSDPEAGAEMHEPPGEVTIEFSEPLQDSSGMTVKDGCGNKVSEGTGRIVGTAMNELNVIVGDAPHRGTYTVEYVATGVTGTATGSFDFVVHGGTACDGSGGGGNHGGHNNGGGGNTGGGNHGGHDGSGGGDHNSSGGTHNGGATHNGSDHNGSDHNGSDHDMDDMDMSEHDEHQNMKHKNNNRHDGHKGGKHPNQGNGGGPIAAPDDLAGATDIPTGTTVVIALGLAILMGLIGGWVLRMSTPN